MLPLLRLLMRLSRFLREPVLLLDRLLARLLRPRLFLRLRCLRLGLVLPRLGGLLLFGRGRLHVLGLRLLLFLRLLGLRPLCGLRLLLLRLLLLLDRGLRRSAASGVGGVRGILRAAGRGVGLRRRGRRLVGVALLFRPVLGLLGRRSFGGGRLRVWSLLGLRLVLLLRLLALGLCGRLVLGRASLRFFVRGFGLLLARGVLLAIGLCLRCGLLGFWYLFPRDAEALQAAAGRVLALGRRLVLFRLLAGGAPEGSSGSSVTGGACSSPSRPKPSPS